MGEMVRTMYHDIMWFYVSCFNHIVITWLRKCTVVFQVCSVPWGEEEFLYKPVSAGGVPQIHYPIISPAIRWVRDFTGNWGIEKLRHMTNIAQLEGIRAGTQTPAWPRISTFSFITQSTASGWKQSSPARQHVYTCMWLGACQGKGSCHLAGVALFHKCIISWQVLCIFIMVNTLHIQSTKEADNSGVSYDLKFEDMGLHLFVCLLSVYYVPDTGAAKVNEAVIKMD